MSAAGRSGARRPVPAGQGSARQEASVLRPIAVRQSESSPVEEHHLGDRLTAYLDGELGHDDRERVQAHLATCAGCLAEAEEARSVKQLLTRTDAPGPSGQLMARLLAVAALPDDEDHRPGGGSVLPSAPTLGGSRLTGGSFGHGAGASFGSGALGAGSPLPGVDPRPAPGRWYPETGRGPDGRLWSGRRGASRSGGSAESQRPAALGPRSGPGAAPRGRRLVVAAAGAFSVAAVALGGFGSLGLAAVAGDSPSDEQHGTAVNPQVPGGVPAAPLHGPQTVDLPFGGPADHGYDLLSPGPTARGVSPVAHGRVSAP
ncbi:zf-HC2 domain-containing protein [Kitasatospora sp. NBC_01250]|uniref:zf-HC2 domain-containing protein n=1 Tax=Kitasatospora sp. NBC_01250 TaxID=2903571 RepID=UPI002E3407D5|nr:zf-HC2 domain-containing protein [Kitasatospora sp. NBC_01250]